MSCNCMDLTTTPGTLVIFANPENGYEYDQKRAREFLNVGCAYTVAEIDVGDSSSRVRFEEYPGVWFNTVLFNNIEETMKMTDDEMKTILPGTLQCLYAIPGNKVRLTTELSVYDMAVASWGQDCKRTTYFYRGAPPTPADLGETSRILYREIQRIDNDLPPQP